MMRISDLRDFARKGLGASAPTPTVSANLLVGLLSTIRDQARNGQCSLATQNLAQAHAIYQALGSPSTLASSMQLAQEAVSDCTRNRLGVDTTVGPSGEPDYDTVGSGTNAERLSAPYSLTRTREGPYSDPLQIVPRSSGGLRGGLGYPTLAQHGAVCPPGFIVMADSNGDEVCVPCSNGMGSRGSRRGLSGPFQDQQAQLTALTQAVQQQAIAGNLDLAQSLNAQAHALYDQMGDPPSLAGQMQFSDQLASGDSDAISDAAGGSANLAAAQANQPSSADLLIGDVATSAPARAVTTVGGWTSAIGITQPQSGADLVAQKTAQTTINKLTFNTKKAAIGGAVGTALGGALGGALGKGQGAVAGGVLGGLLGALAGYATGGDS